jgi:hypothetical protein
LLGDWFTDSLPVYLENPVRLIIKIVMFTVVGTTLYVFDRYMNRNSARED